MVCCCCAKFNVACCRIAACCSGEFTGAFEIVFCATPIVLLRLTVAAFTKLVGTPAS